MKNRVSRSFESGSTRRAFLKRSAVAAGASTLGAGLFERSVFAFGQEGPEEKREGKSHCATKQDQQRQLCF